MQAVIQHTKRSLVLSHVLFFVLVIGSCNQSTTNRLSTASSPYLQEHADNPVDWYEWGDEALDRAKKENKPLLVSIGYASCHWCHVMEKESFMDTAVARIMNEQFICIKVDREERPDIDQIYSNACELITGSSGWPLNAFALPDGRPFFAGTYYSKKSWINILQQIAATYKNTPGKIALQAQVLANGIRQNDLLLLTDTSTVFPDKIAYNHLFDSVYQQLDTAVGGLKGAPKFPAPYVLEYLFQHHFATGDQRSLQVARATLDNLAFGGIHDQVGGGFARYAVDSLWHIPHFEKMLYDNAQLLSAYSHAYQLTADPFYKEVAQGIIKFVQNDLTGSSGEWFSSLNADTPDGEGSFYAWTRDEFTSVAGAAASLLAEYYNLTKKINWENNKYILIAKSTPAQYAREKGIDPVQFQSQLTELKKNLLAKRNKRTNPSLDNKTLTSWNALMLKGFIDAFKAFADPSCLEAALSNAMFIEKKLIRENGQLWRSFTNGKPYIDGLLEDYAYLADAFIALYQVTFDIHWLTLSKQLAAQAKQIFPDTKSGMFFTAASDLGSTGIQKITLADNALPSPNAVMGRVLYFLGVYFEDEAFIRQSLAMVKKMADQLATRSAVFHASWCSLTGLHTFGLNEVAVVGKDAPRMGHALQKSYLPFSAIMGSVMEENLPLLAGKSVKDKTMFYVCSNKTCKQPVADAAAALKQIDVLY